MLTHEENQRLCRVGPDAPMGRMLRRYWIPAALSSELEAGGAPRRTRLLGEDLVAFRGVDGVAGVLDENCPHRGASLVLARNEGRRDGDGRVIEGGDACGLRCLYHGWKITASGRVLETPAEPEESNFAERVRAIAYPVYEAGGIVWTYMGPAGSEPPRMTFDWMAYPAENRMIHKAREECNWAQCLEGVIDSAHSNYLHANVIKPAAGTRSVKSDDGVTRRPSGDGAPRLEAENTPYGFRYGATRRPLVDPETQKLVRITLFIAPFYSLFPGSAGWTHMQLFVPIDDEHTMFHFIQVHHDGPLDAETRLTRQIRSGMRPGVDLDAQYGKIRTRENLWLQDRGAMENGSWTGIVGVNNEDIAMQEGMGAIYDRTKEHLGASDVAVIRMRRVMLDSLKNFEAGGTPVGLEEPVAYEQLRAEEKMLPLDAPWQTPVSVPC